MGVTTNTYTINSLTSTSSFYDWYQKENSEIIAKLNLLQVYGATSGDGIKAITDSSGLLTLTIGGTSGIIRSPLTFNNTVTFNGTVNVPAINVQVTGITSGTKGYTFGTPVRIYFDTTTNAVGFTAAKANNPDNAEVYGILSSRGTTASYITVAGKIDGDFSGVWGKGITAGCIYFLDGTSAGAITVDEPNITGYVSKPLIMGLSGNSGLVLTYRGNYLNDDMTSYGASGSHQIAISIDTGVYTTANTDILVGDVLSYSPEYAITATATGNRKNFGGWFHSRDDSGELQYVVGVVIAKQITGGNLIVTIQLEGYTNVYSSATNGALYLTSDFDLADRSTKPQLLNTASDAGTNTLIALVYDDPSNSSVIRIRPSVSPATSAAKAMAATVASTGTIQNILVNGNFEIWQRSEIGRETSYTTTGNVIFADMWRRHDGVTGGSSKKNYYISRKSFTTYQSDVEGNPNYYLDIKALGLSANAYPGVSGGSFPAYSACDHLMVGHVVPGAKYFDGKNVSVSFYAKTSHANYNSALVYLARYAGSTLLDYTVLGSVSLGTSWDRYDISNYVDYLDLLVTPLTNDYCEIGLDLIPLITQAKTASEPLITDVHVSLSSMNAGIGDGYFSYHNFRSYDEQLKYCQQYYYSTYARAERVGVSTMTAQYDVSTTTPYLVPIPNYATIVHSLPAVMRTTPTVSIYSPYSGTTDEAYNGSALRELRYTSGTYGYGGAARSAPAGSTRITATPTINNIRINLINGYVPYDQVYYHFIADADYSI